MKKLIILFLTLLFLLSISSCGGSSENKEPTITKQKINTRDEVERFASAGEMPDSRVKLGMDRKTLWKQYPDSDSDVEGGVTNPHGTEPDDGDDYINAREHLIREPGEKRTKYSDGKFQYFIQNNAKKDAIGFILSLTKAYNFTVGIDIDDEVEYALGTPDKKDIPPSSDLFYFFGELKNAERYTYIFGKNRLDFIFDNSTLMAIALIDTENWTGYGESE